jgi:hypothetical protein
MFWKRLKAKWHSHDEALAQRELRREAADAEAGRDSGPVMVTPYLDQAAGPGASLTHPERGDEPPRD